MKLDDFSIGYLMATAVVSILDYIIPSRSWASVFIQIAVTAALLWLMGGARRK